MNSQKILEGIKPSPKEINEFRLQVKEFVKKLEKIVKSLKIKVDVFVGGSFAKGTVMKKDVYDADVFLRFDKRHKNDMQKLMEKILSEFSDKTKIHGSRDYFIIKMSNSFVIEVVPVLKIKSPREAENITDLSYFHVNYIRRKLSKKLLNETVLAKTFCHASGCYGAESYIKGFSGYGIELLINEYKSFSKFVREISKMNVNEKKVIDTDKKFKNRQEILMNLNGAKLQSPIVLIDPTFKQRNALAALSKETFIKFQKYCKEFLKNPNERFFDKKESDFAKLAESAKKRKSDFTAIEIKTDRQEGDIAGSKLLKFYEHILEELEKSFVIKKKEFDYENGKKAKCFFEAKSRKEILHKGPKTNDEENVKNFRKKHKNTFTKSGRIYSKEKINFKIGKFLEAWKAKNAKRMKEMHVVGFEIVKV